MPDPSNLSVKLSVSAVDGPQHGTSTSISAGSGHHCAACCTMFSRPEPSQHQGSFKSPRPLPIPPLVTPILSIPTSLLSTSSVTSTTPGHLSCRSHSQRPLPKMPRSGPSPFGTTGCGTDMNERPPPTRPANHGAPQQLANSKEIHRGKSSKHQPGEPAPPDPIPLKVDAGELPRSDEKHPCHPPLTPRSVPSPLGTTGRGTDMNELPLLPVRLADHAAPQQLANSKGIHRGKSFKLQPGDRAPPDPIPLKPDAGELSNSPRSDEKHPCHPLTHGCVSRLTDVVSPILETTDEESNKLVKKYSRRWLREEKGKRWVEEDYNFIARCLRELR